MVFIAAGIFRLPIFPKSSCGIRLSTPGRAMYMWNRICSAGVSGLDPRRLQEHNRVVMSIPKVDTEFARNVLRMEAARILDIADRLGDAFIDAARCVYACKGQVVMTGLGKAGIIATKLSATLASTGTRSIFLHPVEALHGDLGRVTEDDVVIAFSNSGTTEEILRLLDHTKARRAAMIAVTGAKDSPLASHADVVLDYGPVEEACPHGLAPTVSTTCMLAMGDALALTVMQMRQFGPEDFAIFHPAGALGRKLLKVSEVMTFRPGEHLNLVSDGLTLGDALAQSEATDRRSGAMLLVNEDSKLSGILTDADLRRVVMGNQGQDYMAMPVADFMTHGPKHVHEDDLASEALAILNKFRIDELPVVNAKGNVVGIIDVQDLLGVKSVSDEE